MPAAGDSRFGGTLSKNFQCKSCITAKSLNGVLAAISSTVCLLDCIEIGDFDNWLFRL